MRKLAFAAVLVLGLVPGLAAPAAASPPHEPWGQLCGLTTYSDPGGEPGTQTGEIDAGPVFVGDGVTATVTCVVQVGAANGTHWGSDAALVTGDSSADFVTASGVVSFSAGSDDPVYLCTRVDYTDGTILYYNDSNDPLVDGAWNPWGNGNCGLLSSFDGDDTDPIEAILDSIVCPVLAIVFSWDGDIVLPEPIGKLWDCPPYDWNGSGTVDGYGSFGMRQFVPPPPGAFDPTPGPIPPVPVACNDGVDNDGDGRTDYPSDPDCSDWFDTSEAAASSCPAVAGVTYCTSLTATTEYQRFDVAVPSGSSAQVAGYVDAYEFVLPNGGRMTLPCVVLVEGTTTVDPCRTAGGTWVARTSTLVDQTVGQPGLNPGSPLATVKVCNANLVLTVNGFGVSSFPAYTVC